MIYKLLNILDKKLSFVTVSAKSEYQNYDPLSMQLTVLTLIRNTDLMNELNNKSYLTVNEQIQFSHLLTIKLEHYQKLKSEVVLLIKHFNSELPEQQLMNVDEILNNVFIDNAINSHYVDNSILKHLLTLVNTLVAMYWKSKGLKTVLAQCSSPLNYPLCIRC